MSNNNDDFDPQPEPEGRGGPSVSLVLFGIFALVTVIFIFQNGGPVTANFLWMHPRTKLWVAIVVSVALGIVLDRLILTWWRRARKRKND